MKNELDVSTSAVDVRPDIEEALPEANVKELKKRSISGALSYFVRTAFIQVLGIVSFAIIGGALSPEEIGIFGIVIQLLALLTFFSDIGFASALIQKKTNPTTTEYRTVFTVQMVLSLLIFLVSAGFVAAGYFENWSSNILLLVMAGSFGLSTLKTIPSVMLERKLLFSKLVIPQMVEQVLYNALLVYCAINGYGIWSYSIAVGVRSVLGVVVMFAIQRWPIGISFNRAALKGLFGTGVKFQANDLLARVKDNLFYLIMSRFLVSPTEFGYISFAKTYSQFPYNLTVQNVVAITFPTFSRLQHDPALLRKAIEKTLFFVTLAIFPLLVGMSVLIGPLMAVVPQYGKWQPALWTFIFFTLSIAWAAISTPLTNTLNALGKINQSLLLMIMWTVLTWVLTPLLYWKFGLNGISLAALIISFTSIVPVILVKRVVAFSFADQVWRQSLAAGVMLALGWWGQVLWSRSLWWLLAGGALISLSYLAVLLATGWQKLYTEVKSIVQR